MLLPAAFLPEHKQSRPCRGQSRRRSGPWQRGEDGLAVAFEDLQPVVEILWMTHVIKGDAGVGTEKSDADLGHRFFEGVTKVTETGTKDPVQPVGMA